MDKNEKVLAEKQEQLKNELQEIKQKFKNYKSNDYKHYHVPVVKEQKQARGTFVLVSNDTDIMTKIIYLPGDLEEIQSSMIINQNQHLETIEQYMLRKHLTDFQHQKPLADV